MNDMIAESIEYLKEYLSACNAPFEEIEYRIGHSLRVANIGRRIAEVEGGDIYIVTIACILHDIGKFDTKNDSEHGRVSEGLAMNFLKNSKLSVYVRNHICHCIGAHVDRISCNDHIVTLEEKIVRDADTIDRFGAHKTKLRMFWELENESCLYHDIMNDTMRTLLMLEDNVLNRKLETEEGQRRFEGTIERQISFYRSLVEELSYSFDIV